MYSLNSLRHLGELAGIDFGLLVAQGITGCEVWDPYKQCNYSIAAFHECIMDGTAMAKLEAVPDSRFQKEQAKKYYAESRRSKE